MKKEKVHDLDDGISGYTVVKHSWRGRYRRLMSIKKSGITTYNPNNLEVTNTWEYKDITGVNLLFKEGPNFFNLCVPKEKGKPPTNMKFESVYAKEIITDILTRYRHLKIFNESMHQAYAGYKLCRNGDNIPVSIYCTPCGLEIWSNTMKKCISNFFYIEMNTLHYVSDISGCFVIQTRFDSRKHAFGSNRAQEILNTITDKAATIMGCSIKVSASMTSSEYYISRLGRLGNDDALMMYTTFNANKYSRRFSQPVPRIIGVSELCLVEHDPSTYSVVTARSLKRIYSIVRDLDNPQRFGIEWVDGWHRVSYYTCPDRDALISTFLDAVRTSGNIDANVHSMPTKLSKRFSPLSSYVDEELEIMCIRNISSNESKLFENIITFNTNIPYSGFHHAHSPDSLLGDKKEKVILSAINFILQFESDFAQLGVVNIEHTFQALKRLFSSKAGFDSFTIIPKLNERLGSVIISGFKRGDAAITYAAIEVMNALILPLHPNADLYQEQQNKLSLLAEKKFIRGLLEVLKINILRATGALIISALLDFLTFILCLPFSETTDQQQFESITQLVSDVGYPLFKLFQHPSPYIVKSAGMLMKSLIEEASPEICENIQTLALTEGVFPKHLLVALFTQTSSINSTSARQLVNRQLSRKLLILWLRNNPFAFFLLKRSLPMRMVNFLYSTEQATESALSLSTDRTEIKLDIENKKELDVFIRKTLEKMDGFFKHWHTRIAERVPYIKKPETLVAKVLILRRPKEIPPLSENWDLFYQKFYQDHYLPDLIWNHKTREELKDSLEAEIRSFNIDKDLGSQVRISWNFDDYEVQYPSLQQEITIGEYYIKPLLDQDKFELQDPVTFFTDLYHVYLQSKTTDMKYSCLKCLAKIYRLYYEKIGKFNDIPYIVHLLKNSRIAIERDLILLFIHELVLNKDNVRKILSQNFIVHVIDLANLAHLHSNRANIPLQTLMLEIYEQYTFLTNEWYFENGPKDAEPVSIEEIRRMYLIGEINENTKVWAQGMEGWKAIIEITQLKWTVFNTEAALLNESDLAVLILDILIRIVSFFPSKDGKGGIIRPVPRAKRLLSEVSSLPHLSQLLLTFHPPIVERVSILLENVMEENPVLPQLFVTGYYFFLLMYTGHNIGPIAKFLKYSHLKQGFRNEADKSRNTLLSNSILSPLLPEAMISYLETYDSQNFAEIFLGEFDNPEIIWSKEMRRYMMEKISLHLADFTPRLKSNIKSVYMYCPIPHIEYEQLKSELFCGKYYLRNLCDTQSFPNWPIVDPVQTLRDILDAWKEEVNKKPPPMSVDQAYETLELETGIRHDDSVVRRAYYKLAVKYHPDKNPEGREIFEKIVNSYEFLCSKSVKEATPSNYNITLILKSQSILFINHKKTLEPYKYPGYPMLIKTIKLEAMDENLFAKDTSDALLLPSVELAHHTIACSSLNAEELRREDGILVLQTVFERCIHLITSQSKASDMNVLVIMNVLRCFIASTRFDGFINAIIELPQILVNFNHILMHHDNLTALCAVTMECIISLCCSYLVQMRLLNSGLLYHMVYYMFFYDYTLAEAGISVSHETNLQEKFNEMAKLSIQGLGIMSVSGNEDVNNIPINQILNILLTEYIVTKMTLSSPSTVLKLLNSNIETPYFIWDNSTRDQLKQLLESIRKYNPDKEIEHHKLALNFKFDKHMDELVIGNIFIRIFNKMPTYKIDHPNEFASHLIIFIKEKAQYISSFMATSNTEISSKILDDTLAVFKALSNLISNNSLIFSTIKQNDWISIFSFFLYIGCLDIQREVLNILSIVCKDIQSVTAISCSGVLGFLNLALENLPFDRELTLSIYQSLFSNSSIVKEAVTKGTLIYLLFIFCYDKGINVRNLIVELFARLLTDRLTGPRIKIILLKFFPTIFIDAILDDSQAAVLLFESKQENPELTWNDEARVHVASVIKKMKTEFFEEQSKDPSVTWKIRDDFTCFDNIEEGLVVSGVNLKRFISQPSWVLRHPRDFLIGLLDKLSSIYKHSRENEVESLEMVTEAFCLFLEFQPSIADQIPALGHLPEIVNLLERSQDGSIVIKSALNVLKRCLKNRPCLIELEKNDRWITALISSFQRRPDSANIAAEALHIAFDHSSSISALQALRADLVPKILDLLNNSFTEIPEPSATRAHIVSALQQMAIDPQFGVEISQILSKSKIWTDYKSQKHDLFIENPNSTLKISAAPVGVAGYLTAAHNTAPTSLSNANTLRMLTGSHPPKPL